MSNAPTNISEYGVIAKVVQHYIDGAKSGRGDDMKPAFHKDATIFGYVGADLFARPHPAALWPGMTRTVQRRGSKHGSPASTSLTRSPPCDLNSTTWTGHRFTDLFTLLKVDGEWKIMNKVFHLHP